jgi:hypothetical protein
MYALTTESKGPSTAHRARWGGPAQARHRPGRRAGRCCRRPPLPSRGLPAALPLPCFTLQPPGRPPGHWPRPPPSPGRAPGAPPAMQSGRPRGGARPARLRGRARDQRCPRRALAPAPSPRRRAVGPARPGARGRPRPPQRPARAGRGGGRRRRGARDRRPAAARHGGERPYSVPAAFRATPAPPARGRLTIGSFDEFIAPRPPGGRAGGGRGARRHLRRNEAVTEPARGRRRPTAGFVSRRCDGCHPRRDQDPGPPRPRASRKIYVLTTAESKGPSTAHRARWGGPAQGPCTVRGAAPAAAAGAGGRGPAGGASASGGTPPGLRGGAARLASWRRAPGAAPRRGPPSGTAPQRAALAPPRPPRAPISQCDTPAISGARPAPRARLHPGGSRTPGMAAAA